jgi:enhancer of polycomb-like protein
VVDSYERDIPANFVLNRSYVRYHRPTTEDLDSTLEYVADREDEEWLRNNTKFGGSMKAIESSRSSSEVRPLQPQLALRLLEHMLDLLEKATGFESIITIQEAQNLFSQRLPQLFHLFPVRGQVTVKHVIQDVYHYWLHKRSKLKRPLLRRFWPVTSTDDTNPHLVFRPREKEKYKLRKKRQNDAGAYRKMKQLRDDFDSLRAVLDLVRRREELNRAHVQLQVELFQQRLYEVVDTSGLPRTTRSISKKEVDKLLDLPVNFEEQMGRVKCMRKTTTELGSFSLPISSIQSLQDAARASGSSEAAAVDKRNVAGRNHGEPAPNFLHPLQTRETYATTWDSALPQVSTWQAAQAEATFRFRHRPRVGRGGRLCIDRMPHHNPPPAASSQTQTVLTAGHPMPRCLEPAERLLDLLPVPLDRATLSRKIEGLSIAAIKEDFEARAVSAATGGDPEENDGDEVIVKLDHWLETDDSLWGDERFATGPI